MSSAPSLFMCSVFLLVILVLQLPISNMVSKQFYKPLSKARAWHSEASPHQSKRKSDLETSPKGRRIDEGKKSSVEAEEDKSNWRKSDARARRILLDSVGYHLVPQISQKKMTRNMFKTLNEWWFLMAKPDLYGKRRSNVVHYTPLVVGGEPPQC